MQHLVRLMGIPALAIVLSGIHSAGRGTSRTVLVLLLNLRYLDWSKLLNGYLKLD